MEANKPLGDASILHLLAGNSSSTALSTAQTLLEQGKDPNKRNEDGLTPVHVAASWGNYEMLKLLLVNGGDPSTIDDDGKTPSDLAFDENHLACLALLKWWKEELNDSVVNVSCSTCSSPVVKNSPIAQIYTSPRYFTSPLKERSNNKNTPEPKSPMKKSWRKIDFDENCVAKFSSRAAVDVVSSDESFVTKDEDSPSKSKKNFIQFNGGEATDVANIDKTTRRIGCLDLSCCSRRSSLSPPYAPQNSDVTVPILNNTVSFDGLNELFADDDNARSSSYATVAEEVSTILRLAWKERKNNSKTNDDVDEEQRKNVESTLKRVLEESIRRDLSEIEQIDPRRLSFCKKLSDVQIRQQLTQLGYDVGPITNTTRWLYVRRLALASTDDAPIGVKKFSPELERLLTGGLNLDGVETEEASMRDVFDKAEKAWREGCLKMSFCYLLLDPSKFPSDVKYFDEGNFFKIFVESIFYIGKGKKSRPLQHLIEAAKFSNANNNQIRSNAKIQKILQLWNDDKGVISLHVFHNTIPVEAYTREAAMIDAIGIQNLTNVNRGDYYGLPANWTVFKRRRFGAYLLKTAAAILKLEGHRPLKINDVIVGLDS